MRGADGGATRAGFAGSGGRVGEGEVDAGGAITINESKSSKPA